MIKKRGSLLRFWEKAKGRALKHKQTFLISCTEKATLAGIQCGRPSRVKYKVRKSGSKLCRVSKCHSKKFELSSIFLKIILDSSKKKI